MATSMLVELSCSVCLETYTDPVTLPCMHSFCRQCLLDLSQTCTASVPSHGGISCPECRQTTDLDEEGVNGLPKNCTLANLIEKLDKDQDKHDPNCSVCDTSPGRVAVKVCFDCNLSYCGECISLHPSRGMLAKHVLVNINEDDSCTQAPVSEKTEHKHEGYDPSIFCHTCNELVENEKIHIDHTTIGLKKARLNKCTSLAATLEKLEKTRGELRRGIYQSETCVEQLPEEKQKQLCELATVMDDIRKNLTLKESELSKEIHRIHTESVCKIESEIRRKKTQQPEITNVINMVQALLEEELDDSSFLKRSVELDKCIQSFEHMEDSHIFQDITQTLTTDLNDLKKMALMITNVLQNQYLDRFLGEGAVHLSKDRIQITALRPKSHVVSGQFFVQWKSVLSEQTYDVKVHQIHPDRVCDDGPVLLYSSVKQTELLVPNLFTDTEYKVSVMIHGHPETESEPHHTMTLPAVDIQQSEHKVKLIAVTPKWDSECGSLMVQWAAVP